MSTTRRRPNERGLVVVVAALSMVAVLIVAALVIDMSMVRQNRQTDKSTADFAAAAGIRGLDNPAGQLQPWSAVCAALEYLVANNDEMIGLTGTYRDGIGTTFATSPCDAPTSAPYTTTCSVPSTWAVFEGSADGGRIGVRIQSGYIVPDAAFPEDSTAAYASDPGDPVLAGCDQLAVIIDEAEGTYFGSLAGASGYETRVRSVARLVVENPGESTPALLLLERHDCRVLAVSGTSGAKVIVEGVGPNPGLIHADSIADGSDCSASDPQNGNVFQVDGNPSDPRIIARQSPQPVGAETPGSISTAALGGLPGAVAADASSPWPVEVCRQVASADCATSPPPPAITGSGPTGGLVVGRGTIDRRYRTHIIALRNRAETRFSWDDPSDLPAGWTAVGCNDPGPFTATRVWVDCAGGPFSGNDKTFEASVEELVINGHVIVDGNGKTLHIKSPAAVYIKGSASVEGIRFVGTDNLLRINDGSSTDTNGNTFVCDERYASAPATHAVLVVGSGPIIAEGGSGKVLRMCQTTVFMMDNSGAPACPIPATDGVAPYDNGCRGRIRVAGSNGLDWSAPNLNNVTDPTPAELEQFEDLAFWSESEAPCSSGCHSVEGGGGVRLFGIFFTPNANPFRVGGNGDYDIEDAQFMTRKLEVAGNGTLLLRPQPQNAVRAPTIGGHSLVR